MSNNPTLDLPKNLRKIIENNFWLYGDEINQITSYYDQLEEGKDYIYEAKVLVVGEPSAGKTTLTKKTKDNETWVREMKGKESKSTVGIVIDILPFNYNKDKSKELTTYFWDFGGQNIQYVLHQYFFTESSLYILLADGRKELTNFNYWFEIIATLGKGCPVIVVLNENNSKPIKTFNINEFRKEFGETLESIEEKSVDFYNDSDGRFDTLKAEIQNKVCNLKHIGQDLPKKWVDIRKDIEKIKDEKAYIDKDDYIQLCDKHKLDKEYRQQVLDYLHVLGIALNYKADVHLRNKLILKPNWVIDALYVVLKDNKIEKDKGIFEVDYVDSLWENEGYSTKDCEILLNLMQKGSFEIAYKLVNTNKFIVPILLPYKPIDYQLEETNSIHMKIQYRFMPKGIVSRLIVRLHKNIVTKEEQIVWNKGVLLSHHNSTAEVVEREQSKQILIKVVGKNQYHNKELLTIIRNEIVSIHKDWFNNRLDFEELVPCICEICKEIEEKQLYKLSVLENALSVGKKDIECQTSFASVIVRKLLEGIYIEDKSREDGEFMRSGNTFHIAGNAQIATNPKDNVSITQNNYSNGNQIVNQKLDEMFAKLDENQSQEMQNLVNQLVSVIDEKLVKENKLNTQQVEAFEDIKLSNDWKAKVKLAVPFNWFISQATGLSFELEKELKVSQEINPERVISFLRKVIPTYELQQTEFNEIKVINNEPKPLRD